MSRLSRSPLCRLALLAPLSVASCSLSGEDLEPEHVTSAAAVDDPSESLEPVATEIDAEADAEVEASDDGDSRDDADVSRANETPLENDDVTLVATESPDDGDGPDDSCTSGSEPACGGGDEVTPPDEMDTDTGVCEGPCPDPSVGRCETGDECESGVCAAGACQVPDCSDGVQNGDELGIDCGGAGCAACVDDTCSLAGECDPPPCSDDSCVTATCADGARNQDESGVDCGGSACLPCACTFGTPEVLGDPNFAGNLLYAPSLSPDGLTMYFGLYVAGGPNEVIAFGTRPSTGEPFGLGNLLPAPVNASVEGTPRLASDARTLYFYSERPGGLGGRDIYRAERSTPDANFDLVTNLTEVNSPGTDHLPWVTPDGLSMYFGSDRNGSLDIHRSTRASTTDAWGAPESVAELNTAGLENGMTLTDDTRVIVFASDRLGTSDFFRATRAPGETAFGAPELLGSISSPGEDQDPALSPEGTELYFSSTRDTGESRIWRVARICP